MPEGRIGDDGTIARQDKGTLIRAWYTVVLLMTAYTLSLLDKTLLSLMIAPIQSDLGISDTQFGILTGFAFVLFYSAAGIPIGMLVDKRSRKGIVATGIAFWSATTMLCGCASTFLHLFIARVGVGIGEASLNPAAYSLLSDIFSKEKLARAISMFSVGGLLGVGLAYIFGGALVGALKGVSEVVLPGVGSFRPWQVVFLVAGLPGFVLSLLMLTAYEPTRKRPAIQASSPHSPARFIVSNIRALLPLTLAFGVLLLMTNSFLSWMPAFLMRAHHTTLESTGLLMGLAAGVFGPLGYLSGGFLADYWTKRGRNDAHLRVGVVGLLLSLPLAIGVTLFTNVTVVIMLLCGLLFSLPFPTAAGMAGLQLITPPQFRGRVSATFMVAVNMIGAGLGPLIVALFTDYVFGGKEYVGSSLLAVSCIFIPLGALAFLFGMRPFGEILRSVECAQATAPGPPTESTVRPEGMTSASPVFND